MMIGIRRIGPLALVLAGATAGDTSARQLPVDTAAVVAAALNRFHSHEVADIVQTLSCPGRCFEQSVRERRSAAADTVIRRIAAERQAGIAAASDLVPECRNRSKGYGRGYRLQVSSPETRDGVVRVGVRATCVYTYIPRRLLLEHITYKVELVDGIWRITGVLGHGRAGPPAPG